jgi:hypothetical protein
LSIVRDVNSLFVNWQNVAVNFSSPFPAIDSFGARDEFRRIDHVTNTAWMNNTAGRRQLPHEETSAAGMVKMYVR